MAPALTLTETDRIKVVDDFVSATDAIVTYSGNQAFYRPSTDTITMPPFTSFVTADDFAATLLHELTHYAVSRIMPHDRVWRLLCLLSAMQQFGIIRAIRKRRSSVVSGPLFIRYTHKSGSPFAPTPASTSQRLKVF
jgi:hypothetical protein